MSNKPRAQQANEIRTTVTKQEPPFRFLNVIYSSLYKKLFSTVCNLDSSILYPISRNRAREAGMLDSGQTVLHIITW